MSSEKGEFLVIFTIPEIDLKKRKKNCKSDRTSTDGTLEG